MMANLMFGYCSALDRRGIAHEEADGDNHIVPFQWRTGSMFFS